MSDIQTILSANKIIPVLVLHQLEDTVPLCEAILEGGLNAIEITLRTEVALSCIAEAAKRFPQLTVGAGTLMTPDHVRMAIDSGAGFGVSPGITEKLRSAVLRHGLPFLPGGASVSEFMKNADAGFFIQKFFPAEQSGGSHFLKSIASPLQDLSFCPTGGINGENAKDYLSLPNVIAIGGSWFVSPERIKRREWGDVSRDIRAFIKQID